MPKILFLIDDDQDDREIFREAVALCDPDIELVFAADGVEAVEILNSGQVHPDVIFLDYNMPRMNGVDCLRILKTNSITKQIPTIMYTTSGDREDEKVVRFLGADYYMQKTVSFESLCHEMKRVLDLIDAKVDLKTIRR